MVILFSLSCLMVVWYLFILIVMVDCVWMEVLLWKLMLKFSLSIKNRMIEVMIVIIDVLKVMWVKWKKLKVVFLGISFKCIGLYFDFFWMVLVELLNDE